jgi:hypothetical protein
MKQRCELVFKKKKHLYSIYLVVRCFTLEKQILVLNRMAVVPLLT